MAICVTHARDPPLLSHATYYKKRPLKQTRELNHFPVVSSIELCTIHTTYNFGFIAGAKPNMRASLVIRWPKLFYFKLFQSFLRLNPDRSADLMPAAQPPKTVPARIKCNAFQTKSVTRCT
jgi:hypothetical protein